MGTVTLLDYGSRPARAAADMAGRAAVAGLDAVLAWRYTDEAIRRVLDSPAVEHALGYALRGPLVDALARDLVRYAVLERVADEVVDAPEVERLAARLVDSRLLDAVVERLLESDELWLLVDEVAQSPAVTDAIGRQGVGFAEQVAGQVRTRSRRADANLERVARRLLRRKPSAAPTEAG